jgi:hypothetical protein
VTLSVTNFLNGRADSGPLYITARATAYPSVQILGPAALVVTRSQALSLTGRATVSACSNASTPAISYAW